MKSKKYRSTILLGTTLIIGIHFSLLTTGIFHLPYTNLVIIESFLFALFLTGALIISPGLDKAPDNFVNRFTLLTTMQLLSVMVGVLILAMNKPPHFKMLGYHLFGIFVCLLVIQAISLVKMIKK